MASGTLLSSSQYNERNGLWQSPPFQFRRTIRDVMPNTLEFNFQVQDFLPPACLPTERIHEDTRLYGVELEVERTVNTPPDIIPRIYDALPDFVAIKHDGSLDDGFEIVSAPATLGAHRQMWPRFLRSRKVKDERLGTYLAGFRTTTCGMHVHINRKAMSPSVLRRFWSFINSYQHDRYFSRIAGRKLRSFGGRRENYCRLEPHAEFIQAFAGPGRNRYVAVNLSNLHTVEVRIFRSNTDAIGMLKNLDFVDAMISFCEETPSDKVQGRHFLDWFHDSKGKHSYPYLSQWLKRHNVWLRKEVT